MWQKGFVVNLIHLIFFSTFSCGNHSETSFSAQANHMYYIFVWGVAGKTGFFHLQFYEGNSSAYSYCDNAYEISSLPFSLDGETLSSVHTTEACSSSEKQGTICVILALPNKACGSTFGELVVKL